MQLLHLLAEHPASILAILARTPWWVAGILALLVAAGTSQLRERQAGPLRALGVPAALALLSLAAVLGTFPQPLHQMPAVAAWLAAGMAAAALVQRGGQAANAAQYDPHTRRFTLPGSAWPLVLMLAIFLVRYAVNVELALAPRHLQEAGFVLAVSAVYGAFAGAFAGRALRLLRLVRLSPTARFGAPA